MAVVQLADAIIPAVYLSYQTVDDPELTAFFQSGVIVNNPLLDNAFNGGGKTAHVPFWKDIDQNVEPNYSTDDPAVKATPDKIVAGEQIVRTAQMNKGMSAADLVSELAGSDPMIRIRARYSTYWQRQFQRRVLASCLGVLADNIANDGSDMCLDASIADGNNATDAQLFNRGAFVDAAFTLGDAFGKLSAIAVHSIIYKRMVKNEDIDFIKDSTGTVNIPTYMGYVVVVDDGMPVVAGATSGYVYTSILFGDGSVGLGYGNPRVPVEVFRAPDGGNGGGIEQLWERKSWVIHPFGYKWLEGSVAGFSPTFAELKLAANWRRQIQRKNVPLAFLKTNG
jgi:hypothetical protein